MIGDLADRDLQVGNWECTAGAGMLHKLQSSPWRHCISLVSGTGHTCDKSPPVEYQQGEQNHALLAQHFHNNALGSLTVPGTILVTGDKEVTQIQSLTST